MYSIVHHRSILAMTKIKIILSNKFSMKISNRCRCFNSSIRYFKRIRDC